MFKSILSKYRKDPEAELQMQQELERASSALRLRVERMLGQPSPAELAS